MSAYTYSELYQAVQDFTENDEATFVSQIDRFIKNAEEKILKQAQLEVFRKNATVNLPTGQKYLPKPSDWLFSYSLLIEVDEVRDFLLQKDFTFIQDYAFDETALGVPRFYADYDVGNFILAPTPDDQYRAELNYFYRPQSIVDSDDGTSWLGTNAGPAMLYGSLVEAYVFMKGEPDMIQSYEQMFQTALGQIKQFANMAEGRDTLRKGSD